MFGKVNEAVKVPKRDSAASDLTASVPIPISFVLGLSAHGPA
jgi:hypothetical protein